MSLRTGAPAPDFTLTTAEGTPFTLSRDALHTPVVLFFYPKNFTAVCTSQACDLRDHHSVFEDMGIQLVGISGDKTESHQLFQDRYKLPYTLLSDPGHAVAAEYGALYPFIRYPKRITYLLDAEHRVLFSYSNMLSAAGHRDQVLAYIREHGLDAKWQSLAKR